MGIDWYMDHLERYIRTLIPVLSLVICDQFILQIQLSTLVTILVQLMCT